MKKIILLSILVLMTIILISCSNNSEQAANENAAPQQAAGESETSTPADSPISKIEKNSGADINVSLGKTGENMSLPEGFPDKVLPLPEDANIVNVNDDKDAKAIGITFKTDKNLEEIITFYQEVMKSGAINMEEKRDDAYLLMGNKDKYNIVISASKYNGDNISVLLHVSSF